MSVTPGEWPPSRDPKPPFPARTIGLKPAVIGISQHVYLVFPSRAERRWFEEWLLRPETYEAYLLWAHEEASK